jgi:hypothetical protein
MATVSDLLVKQREALHGGKSLPPGPPVLLEASSANEVLLPKAPRPPGRRKVWATQPFTLEDVEGEQRQERIDRMMALQPLVGDDARVLELASHGQHHTQDIAIGRAKRNDVVIEDDTISSVHAAIQDNDGVCLLIDRGSSNGTFVNHERLRAGEPVPLASGDCVRFGRRVYYFLSGERLLLFLELRIVKSGGGTPA